MKEKLGIILTGAVIGILASLLIFYGNPGNMGVCIACFLRDISGALGLHQATAVQYLRPEIIGIILGAFLSSWLRKERVSQGGSSPILRFFLGLVVMIGALVFLGCPLRLVQRLAGGDLNAIMGLGGFSGGILIGIFFLNRGFSLRRAYPLSKLESNLFPLVSSLLLLLLLTMPLIFNLSEQGPGSLQAPLILSLLSGLIIGALSQRFRLCMVGGIRDLVLFKDYYLILGFGAIFFVALLANLSLGYFKASWLEQPIAHHDGLWNFLGMALVGWGSVLLGGCPLRQLVQGAEGNSDSVITILGMLTGAALAHNFSWAASVTGPTFNSKVAVCCAFVFLGLVSFFNSNIMRKGDNS